MEHAVINISYCVKIGYPAVLLELPGVGPGDNNWERLYIGDNSLATTIAPVHAVLNRLEAKRTCGQDEAHETVMILFRHMEESERPAWPELLVGQPLYEILEAVTRNLVGRPKALVKVLHLVSLLMVPSSVFHQRFVIPSGRARRSRYFPVPGLHSGAHQSLCRSRGRIQAQLSSVHHSGCGESDGRGVEVAP